MLRARIEKSRSDNVVHFRKRAFECEKGVAGQATPFLYLAPIGRTVIQILLWLPGLQKGFVFINTVQCVLQ
jgi:hypothetical protein